MDIRLDILKAYVAECVIQNFDKTGIDADEIVSTKTTEMLAEVLIAIRDEALTDFDVVEKIVNIFEANNIKCYGRHDF